MKRKIMDLVRLYKEYVNWCHDVNAHPIGFVAWKEKRWNMTFNRRTGEWTKNE
jgi:hypothetical protein